MKLFRKIALFYLIAQFFLVWGFSASRYKMPPYTTFTEIADFLEGHDLGNDVSFWGKVLNDFDVRPDRFIWNYPPAILDRTKPITLNNIRERRQQPYMYLNSEHQQGYRAIFGAFDFESALWGGLLMNGLGEIIHTWDLSTDHLPNTVESQLKNMYGISLQPDGSVIFTMQEAGGGIVKVDACSNILWSIEGEFHHTISPTDHNTFWTYAGKQHTLDPQLAEYSMETGQLVREFDMKDVREANPFLHIFNLQRKDHYFDPTHANDIDPLNSTLAGLFDQFDVGDVLISYRTTNTIFVLDPDSLKVKWWRMGSWDRQHDPDWEVDGTIKVFSNNQIGVRTGSSDIISIDPKTYETKVEVDGKDFGFYSSINGRHQSTPYSTRMVTSTTQGWVFEIDENKEIIFSFVNVYNTEMNESLNLSDAFRYDGDYFEDAFWQKCQ